MIINDRVGNIGPFKNMIRRVGVNGSIGSSVDDIARLDMLITPRVGGFYSGINHLRNSGLVDVLNQRVFEDKILVLAISLGLNS